MMQMIWQSALGAALLGWCAVATAAPVEERAEVVVYGGTSGGVAAAVAAARNHRSVVLIAPDGRLGGMTSGGLGQVDAGRGETIGGIAGEYFETARRAHGASAALYRLTPGIAERVFETMARDAGVRVRRGAALAEADAVVRDGAAIAALRLTDGSAVAGRMFIDCSYEGDLLKAAGVTYTVGRESRAQYGESGAGVRQLRPLRLTHDEAGRPLPELTAAEPGRPGDGDRKVQAYNFRLCVTADPANRVPFPRPRNYRPEYFRNLLEHIRRSPDKKWKFTDFVSLGDLPGGKKFDLNNKGWYSTDFVNASWAYPEASYAERRRIFDGHVDYVQSFLYFLANDERLPRSLREDVSRWGLAADEFTATGNFPHQLYIREARRMVGAYVMIQSDAYENHTKPDSIGMGSYMLDTHWVQKVLAPNGKAYLEGLLGHLPVRPYQISYRSITPRAGECPNLLVPVAMSASHVIYASLRMEPVYMILGHAAGTAAALAIETSSTVQELPYPLLRERLLAEKQILAYPGGEIYPRLAEVAGTAQDDRQAELTGRWTHSSSTGPYVDGSYAYTPPAARATAGAKYRLTAPAAGRYALELSYSPASNRARKAPAVLLVGGRERERFTIDMTRSYDGVFFRLGVYEFGVGDRVELVLSNENAGGLTVADCVRLLPLDGTPAAVRPVEGTVAETPAAGECRTGTPMRFAFQPGAGLIAGGGAPAGLAPDGADRDEVRRLAERILARVLPDGAINNVADPGNVLIIPYFSNFCTVALVRAGVLLGDGRCLDAARRSLRWYAGRIREDGTVHDYKGGSYPDYRDSGTYDSADSYPATFAYALWYYAAATGDAAFARELLPAVRRAMRAAEEVRQTDGLTFAKRDYKIKYLMDNIEVWYGLIAWARLERQFGDGDRAAAVGAWVAELDRALPEFWRPDAEFFEFARGHLDRKRLYPGALANAFAVLYLGADAESRAALFRSVRALLPADPAQWSKITAQTLAWVLLAAQRAEDRELTEQLRGHLAARRLDRDRTHAWALLLHAACGGFNGEKGIF